MTPDQFDRLLSEARDAERANPTPVPPLDRLLRRVHASLPPAPARPRPATLAEGLSWVIVEFLSPGSPELLPVRDGSDARPQPSRDCLMELPSGLSRRCYGKPGQVVKFELSGDRPLDGSDGWRPVLAVSPPPSHEPLAVEVIFATGERRKLVVAVPPAPEEWWTSDPCEPVSPDAFRDGCQPELHLPSRGDERPNPAAAALLDPPAASARMPACHGGSCSPAVSSRPLAVSFTSSN